MFANPLDMDCDYYDEDDDDDDDDKDDDDDDDLTEEGSFSRSQSQCLQIQLI